VFAAEAAVFVHFQLFRGVLLVLLRVVVSLFALVAPENDLDAHFGTSILFASLLYIDRMTVFACFNARKINPSADR
jgi:hypothetical protein